MNNYLLNALRRATLFSVFLLSGQTAFADDTDCTIARSAIQSASVIRKLRIKREVPCKIHEREQIKEFLLETIRTKIPPQKLKYEEVVYKALGLLPESYNYVDGLLELYLSQLGGYYDPEKERYIMAGWLPELFQPTIAVHELTHALQDQYFNLDKFLDVEKETSDALLARSAVVEGDATAVMLDYTRLQTGQSGIASEENVENVMLQNIFGVALSMGAIDAPESLKFLLVFPYTSGLRFAHTLLKKDGYNEINKALRSPPRSTEEILHPEKYGNGHLDFVQIDPQKVTLPGLPEAASVIYSDTLGEFSTSLLLSAHLSDKRQAVKAASGWGGDTVVVREHGGTQYVLWQTEWDSEEDSQEFFEAFSEALKKRFPTLVDEQSLSSWHAVREKEKKKVRLVQTGSTIVFGMEQPKKD
jgi:tetratricopeptide (TPR) repeat protein